LYYFFEVSSFSISLAYYSSIIYYVVVAVFYSFLVEKSVFKIDFFVKGDN